MPTKIHIFAENLPDGGTRSWSYGNHSALTLEQVEAIKKMLPAVAKIIQVNFESSLNYIYPSQEKD